MCDSQAQSEPEHGKTRTQTPAHQPKSCEFQVYLFKFIVEENCTISSEGMNKETEKLFLHDRVRENDQRKDNQHYV